MHKASTVIYILSLAAYYDQWGNRTLLLYFSTHGVYCLLWLHKSFTFPDKNWEQPTGAEGVMIWMVLCPFWITPWYIASKSYEAPAWMMGLAVSTYVIGMFYHFVSDMQKSTYLSLRKGLITEGLWSRTRNPNYFGEFFTYLGFSLLACHWATFIGFTLLIIIVWLPNMQKKDNSLSRYPEFEGYKSKTGMFFPRLF